MPINTRVRNQQDYTFQVSALWFLNVCDKVLGQTRMCDDDDTTPVVLKRDDQAKTRTSHDATH